MSNDHAIRDHARCRPWLAGTAALLVLAACAGGGTPLALLPQAGPDDAELETVGAVPIVHAPDQPPPDGTFARFAAGARQADSAAFEGPFDGPFDASFDAMSEDSSERSGENNNAATGEVTFETMRNGRRKEADFLDEIEAEFRRRGADVGPPTQLHAN